MQNLPLAVFVLIAVLFLPGHAPAVSCHCFQDRSFDPARPDAADAYFLATTQNALIAAALDVPKRGIVKAKMGGADADLLWVVYYVANRTGLETSELIDAYSSPATGWLPLMAKLLESTASFDRPFVAALASPADLRGLATGAYRSVMTRQLGIAEDLLDRLEMSGASRKEQILAIFLSLLLGEAPDEICKAVKSGRRSWGELLASTGLDPKQIEPSWQKLLKLHEMGL